MQEANVRDTIEEAIGIATEMNPQATDGTWLEDLTVQVGPYIKEWDIKRCYQWSKWPERENHYPNTSKQDIGIDAVAVRRSDGEHIAIQCKSRQLDAHGNGDPISKSEADKFVSTYLGLTLGRTLDCNQRQQSIEQECPAGLLNDQQANQAGERYQ